MIAGVFGAAVVLVGGGGCYTERINMAPTVSIMGPTDVWRGQTVTFTAASADADGDVPGLEWVRVNGSCPDAGSNPASWPGTRQPGSSLTVDTPLDPFCVLVVATDSHGATAQASHAVTPRNHDPVGVIDVDLTEPRAGSSVLDKFPLYSELRVSGANSVHDDLDPLSYSWGLLKAPIDSTAQLLPCATDPDVSDLRCLLVDQPGNYEVRLSVSYETGPSSTVTRIITVAEDQLPCLSVTEPILNASVLIRDPKDAVRFQVLEVRDDGDPFPISAVATPLFGVTQFSWFMGRGKEPLEFLDRNFPSYAMPGDAFTIGDEVRVRVEVQDRKTERVRGILDACGPDAATCAGSPGCLQRVTWEVRYR